MKPSDFKSPDFHCWGMLAHLEQAFECERVMRWFLRQAQTSNSWDVVLTEYSYPLLVKEGLLEEIGERQYKLTEKAIDLLYSYYSKQGVSDR